VLHGVLPREYHHTHVPRFAGAVFLVLAHDVSLVVLDVGVENVGVNQNGHEIGIVLRLAIENEKRRFARNGHTDFVGHLETIAPLEVLLGEENIDVAVHLRAQFGGQPPIHRHVIVENRNEPGRKRLRAQMLPASLLEK
jgi:hypothetical protein